MFTPKECAEAWKIVVKYYKETADANNPKVTIQKVVDELGLAKAKEVFAVVSRIKHYDGRIYGRNREYMESIPINYDCVVWNSDNPVIYSGLDDIHTAHINQLIGELKKLEETADANDIKVS